MKLTRTPDAQEIDATVKALNSQMPSNPLRMSNDLSASHTRITPSFTAIWQLPAKLSTFTGRKQPLSDLTNMFLRSSNQLLIQQTPQITGTGGIGKTQLAIQFVHQLLADRHVKTVVWLNADTSVVDQINVEFLRLAQALGIDTKPLDQTGIVRCVYQVLSQQHKVLVVFDSATNYDDVSKYCPPDNSPIRLLVTTRDDQRWVEQFSQCPLSIFSLEEAVEYISKALGERKVSLEDAEKLAACLGRFPLALAQAISYILTRNIDINTYIDLYESKKTTRKKLLDTQPLSEDPHQETLWIAVSLSLEHIEDLNAQNIIAGLSYLAPEMPILGNFVETWTRETEQNQQAIKSMRQFGIVSTDQKTRSIRIHQMVQEVIRLNHDESTKRIILEMIVSKLFAYLSESTDPLQNENRLIVMMAHALSVNSMLATHQCFDDLGVMLKLACLEIRIVEAKEQLGQYQEALRRGLLALDILEGVPEFDQGYAASLMSTIGLCYQSLGKPEEGLPYHLRALKTYDAKYEGNSIVGAIAIINVAGSYIALGKIQKAHEMLSTILPALEKASETVSTLKLNSLYINLSTTYRELGDSETAISLLNRALASERKTYGDDHPKVAGILENLSAIYSDLNQHDSALPLIEKALVINEQRFGKDHLEVAKTLDCMGNVYCGVGRPVDGRNVLQRALKIRVQQLGAQHPQVALTKFNLANAIMNLAITEDALALLDEALKIQQQYYGGYSPEAGRTVHILGNAYHDQGNLDKAIESMTLAIKILERNFGTEHRELAKVYNDISCVYLDRRSLPLAREFGEKALGIFKNTLGPDHIEVARTLNNLANMCRAEMQPAKALSLLQSALPIFEKRLGQNHLQLAHPLMNIGFNYLSLKEHGKAKEYLERALNISIAGFETTDHPDIAMIQLQLAGVEVKLGSYDAAYEHSAAAYQYYNRKFGPNHGTTRQAYTLMAALQSRPAPRPQVDFLEGILMSDQPLDLPTCIKLVERCLQVNQPVLALHFISMAPPSNDNTALKRLTVRCYLETGETKSAMDSINFAKDKELATEIKQAEQQRKDTLEKIKAFDSNNQITDRIIIQKALLYIQLSLFDQAKTLLQSVIEKTPASEHLGAALYQLARCQYHQQEYARALESLKKSQQIHDNQQVRDLFAKIATARKDVAQLMQITERAFVSPELN